MFAVAVMAGLLLPAYLFGLSAVHLLAALSSVLVGLIAVFYMRPLSHVDDDTRKWKGMVLVRWTGQDAPSHVRLAFGVYPAAACLSTIVGLSMLLQPTIGTFSFKLDYLGLSNKTLTLPNWLVYASNLIYATSLLTFALISVFGMSCMGKEIAVTETRWATPRLYDGLEAALHGKVLLGAEFEHTVTTSVLTHEEQEDERLRDVTLGQKQEKLVHADRPYFLVFEQHANSHLFACGMSGQGKTETAKTIITRTWNARRIPSLILDFKGEYSTRDPRHPGELSFMEKLGGLVYNVPVDFTINPLKLNKLSPLHRAQVAAELLLSSTKLSALQSGEVVEMIMECYKACGISEENSQAENESKLPPTILDVMERLELYRKGGKWKGEKLDSVGWIIEKLRLVKHIFKAEDVDFFDIALKIPLAINLSPLKGVDVAKTLVINAILKRIQEQCEEQHLSKLRLIVVVDEAHRILKTEMAETGLIRTEPLLIQILRESRKYGFAMLLLSQLATDVQEEAAANVATVLCHGFDQPGQLGHVKKWIDMSEPELHAFRLLPRGGAFIKHYGDPHSHLLRLQLVDDSEFVYSRMLCRRVKATLPKRGKSQIPETTSKLRVFYDNIMKETAKSSEPTPVPMEMKGDELTVLENRLLQALMMQAMTTSMIQDKFGELGYDALLDKLREFEGKNMIQVARVANLTGKSTTFYAALKAERLQAEGLEHRVALDQIETAYDALAHLRYDKSHADFPDLGFPSVGIAIEYETGRKKLTPSDMAEWASHVKERNGKLGYTRTIVVVPSVLVLERYVSACKKHGLELVTMGKLLAHFPPPS
jgi:hypothetical protein